MKTISILSFLLLPLFICAQSIRTDLEIDIPDDCAIDSILIQSMVRAEAKWIPAESRQLAELFHPVDIVLIMAQGASGMATLPPTPLSTQSPTIRIDEGCNSITLVSPADDRVAEFQDYVGRNPTVKEELLLPLLEKNLDAITVMDYLRDYLNGDFRNEQMSRQIVELFEANPNPSSTHQFVRQLISGIRMDFTEVTFAMPDTLLVAAPNNANLPKPTEAPTYRLIDFWYTSCAPCLRDHKLIRADMEAGAFPSDVELTALAIEQIQARWDDFMAENKQPWLNYYVDDPQSITVNTYGVVAFPTYLLVDEQGDILARFHGYASLERHLAELKSKE